jgi:hypothetical protein
MTAEAFVFSPLWWAILVYLVFMCGFKFGASGGSKQ